MMLTSTHPDLQELEEEHDAHFTYDDARLVWCLSGPYSAWAGAYDEAGPYWETDDVPAADLDEAQRQAIAYLRNVHGQD